MNTLNTAAAQERAEQALTNSAAMCQLLAQCREYRVPGWWDGSAFRSHPVGLIVGTIKFTNYWHCDDLCGIELTDGAEWDRNVCQDSFAHGSPHPKPVSGTAIRVWRCGAWDKPDFEQALKARALEILTAAAEHIERAAAARAAAEEIKRAEQSAAREAAEARALQAVTGAAA